MQWTKAPVLSVDWHRWVYVLSAVLGAWLKQRSVLRSTVAPSGADFGAHSLVGNRQDETMKRPTRARRLLASLLFALAVFSVGYFLVFVAPAPKRALYNITADAGMFLFFEAILFVVFGLPLWAVSFLVLSLIERRRSTNREKDD
jgi:hypothetical protein